MNARWLAGAIGLLILQNIIGLVPFPLDKSDYDFGNGSRLRALGSCAVGFQSASCWDLSGHPNQELTKRFQDAQKPTIGIFSEYPGTNVYAVAECDGTFQVNLKEPSWMNGRPLLRLGSGSNQSLLLVPLCRLGDGSAEERQAIAVRVSHLTGRSSFILLPKEGEKLRAGKCELILKKIAPVNLPSTFRPGYSSYDQQDEVIINASCRYWRYLFQGSGHEFDALPEFALPGVRGSFVSSQGIPGPDTRMSISGDPRRYPYPKLVALSYGRIGHYFIAISNVDPKYVPKIEVKPTRSEEVPLGPFALSPR